MKSWSVLNQEMQDYDFEKRKYPRVPLDIGISAPRLNFVVIPLDICKEPRIRALDISEESIGLFTNFKTNVNDIVSFLLSIDDSILECTIIIRRVDKHEEDYHMGGEFILLDGRSRKIIKDYVRKSLTES